MRKIESKGFRGAGMEGLIAAWYTKNTEKDLLEYKKLARKINAQVKEGSRILEVAPGPGFLALELAETGKYKITGLDISASFVEIARKKAAEAGAVVDFKQGDAAKMPFEDESFDFIVCRAAFKNFTNPVGALREMERVLAPNGEVLIEDLRRDVSQQTIDRYVENMGLSWLSTLMTKWTFRFMLIKRAYIKEEIRELISQTGFREFEIKENPMELEIRMVK